MLGMQLRARQSSRLYLQPSGPQQQLMECRRRLQEEQVLLTFMFQQDPPQRENAETMRPSGRFQGDEFLSLRLISSQPGGSPPE